MHEDIQRRFVLGFTMEGCYMRLWYANRSHTVVSVPFDIAPVSISCSLSRQTADLSRHFNAGIARLGVQVLR